MKNLLYILLVVALSTMFIYNSFANCPPNWDSRGIYVNVNGCLYFVVYCYKCGVTGPDGSNVRITYYARLPREQQPNPDNCDDSEIPFNIILENVQQDFYQACEIPACSTSHTLKIIIEYPLCQRAHNVAWWDPEEQKIKHYFWYESCNSSLYYCQIIRWCCRLAPNEYWCPETNIIPQGDPMSCQEDQSLPPPGLSWDENWDTECLRHNSCGEIK